MDIFSKRPLCVAVAVFVLMIALLLFMPIWIKLIILAAALVAGIVLIIKIKKPHPIIGILVAAVLSCIVSVCYFDLYVGTAEDYYGKSDVIRIEIIDVNYTAPYVTYADVKVRKIGDKKVNYNARLECAYSLDAERGEIYAIYGTFSDFEDDTLFNSKRYYNSKGYYLCIFSEEDKSSYIGKAKWSPSSFFRDINEFCEARLKKVLNEDAFGFADGIFLGNRENINPALNRDFTELGISHMIAISGMHLTILIGSIYGLLRKMGIHRKIVIYITLGICIFYVGMTGATPAILRSGIMYIIMSVSTLVMRENDSISSLFATAGIIILISPNAIFDAAFLLSCFSTLGILIVSPGISRFIDAAKKRGRVVSIIAGLPAAIIITIAATVFTLPLTAFYFGRFYFLLPVTNLLFEPLTTLILMLSPFIVVFSYIPFLGDALAWVCEVVTDFMTALARWIAELDVGSVSLSYPFVSVIVIILVAVVFLMMVYEIKNPMWLFVPFCLAIVAFVVCLNVFVVRFDQYDYVYCQNEKRNDMIVVDSLDKTAVIDASYGGKTPAVTALSSVNDNFYDNRVDAYILTHYHNYHPATIDNITRKYYIDTVYLPIVDDDKDLADTIVSICDKNGVECLFYDKEIALSESTRITLDTAFVKRSVHPVVCVDVDFNGYHFAYCSPAYLERNDVVSLPLAVFFGAHGPKVKPVERGFVTHTAVYANEEMISEYGVAFVDSFVLSENEGNKILRIPRE